MQWSVVNKRFAYVLAQCRESAEITKGNGFENQIKPFRS